MAQVKFTKTATQLLYGKKVGDTLVVYKTRKYPEKRQSNAIYFLLTHKFIRHVRQYSYNGDDFGRNKPDMVFENHYEVLKRPDWMES